MNLFSSLIKTISPKAGSTSVSDLVNPRLWLTNSLSGAVSASGEFVSPGTALTLSPYFAAIRVVSEDIAKLPLFLFKTTVDGKEKAVDHPLFPLLKLMPNPDMSSMSFRRALTGNALQYGNGYAEIERNGAGDPIALWPIHPTRVKPIREDGTIVYQVRVGMIGGRDLVKPPAAGDKKDSIIEIPIEDMFHIQGMGGDGLQGWPMIQFAAESLGLVLAAQRFGSSFFSNGAHLGGVLTVQGELKEDAKKRVRESFSDVYRGTDNAFKVGILEEGMKFDTLGVDPKASQWIEGRKFSVPEIARWFRVPPHKIQDLSRSTFNNQESENKSYVDDSLMGWIIQWEQQISIKLLTKVERRTMFAKHMIQAFLRGDSTARSNYYRTLHGISVLNPNEIREFEDLNRYKGGDTYVAPLNFAPVQDLGNESLNDQGVSISIDNPETHLRSFETIFHDTASRVVKKEIMAVTKAEKKYKGDSDGFFDWSSDFYNKHKGFVANSFGPVLSAAHEHLILLGFKVSGSDSQMLEETLVNYLSKTQFNAGTSFSNEESIFDEFQQGMVEDLQSSMKKIVLDMFLETDKI